MTSGGIVPLHTPPLTKTSPPPSPNAIRKMADGGVDIDLYADDIESDFNRQVSHKTISQSL